MPIKEINAEMVFLSSELAFRILGLNNDVINVKIENKDYFNDQTTLGVFLEDDSSVVFNRDLLRSALEIEILEVAMREIRKAFQSLVISLGNDASSIATNIPKERIELWKKEKAQTSDIMQDREIDAISFAYFVLLRIFKHKIDIPKVIEKEVEDRCKELSNTYEDSIDKMFEK